MFETRTSVWSPLLTNSADAPRALAASTVSATTLLSWPPCSAKPTAPPTTSMSAAAAAAKAGRASTTPSDQRRARRGDAAAASARDSPSTMSISRDLSAGDGAAGGTVSGSASAATCRRLTSSRHAAHTSRCAEKCHASSESRAPSTQAPALSRRASWSLMAAPEFGGPRSAACGPLGAGFRGRSWQRLRGAERLAHLRQPESHAPLDGTDGRLEHLGDLGVAEAAEVGELDDAQLVGRERVQRRADLARLVAPRDLDVGALLGGEALLDALVARAPAVVDGAAPQGVDRPVVDDPEDPGA